MRKITVRFLVVMEQEIEWHGDDEGVPCSAENLLCNVDMMDANDIQKSFYDAKENGTEIELAPDVIE